MTNKEKAQEHFKDHKPIVSGKFPDEALPQIPDTNAAGVAYPSIEEQKAYWKQRDIGGNILPDRIEANNDSLP